MTPIDDGRAIRVRGAREHNLRGIDVDIPHDALIAVTGVSGSGKSSLAFDTIYREAERRYLEGFSPQTRRWIARLEAPAVDSLDGLRPALALGQRRAAASNRSTVGTLGGVWTPLRHLFASRGVAHCAACGERVAAIDRGSLIERLADRHAGQRVRILAPIVEGHRGAHRDACRRMAAAGAQTLWIDGETQPIDTDPGDSARPRTLAGSFGEVTVPTSAHPAALAEPAHRALDAADGTLLVEDLTQPGRTERHAIDAACPRCDTACAPLGPRLFSFASTFGACPACQGLGVEDQVDPELLIADPDRTLREGALVPTTPTGYIVYSQVTVDALDTVCRAHGFSVNIPWRDLSAEQQHVVLFGSDRVEVPFGKHPLESRLKWKGITARPRETGHYGGIVPTIADILRRSRNKNALRFARSRPCSACDGSRLRPEARAVRIGEASITDLAALELNELAAWLAAPPPVQATAALAALRDRTQLLRDLGLGYLRLDRSADTLSGGEAQRLRLSTQLVSDLSGMLFVLDEPSAGLHPTDRDRLYERLEALRDRGNTVLSVEHDPEAMLRADWLIDVGPGAGPDGGNLLWSGPPAAFLESGPNASATRRALAAPPVEDRPRRPGAGRHISIRGARAHNLAGLNVDIPLGRWTVVTGVSGAGKTTLVDGTLARAVASSLGQTTAPPGDHDRIEGLESITRLVLVHSAPIGRTPRSNPATYTGIFDAIRTRFAATPHAKASALGKSAFSFNTKGGRCETCEGAGTESIPMHGLAPHLVPCADCGGRRFQDAVLAVEWNGHTIRGILDLTVAEAAGVFAEDKLVAPVLQALIDLGLGYLTLGQPAPTLSGGEAQRVRLARDLAIRGAKATAHTLFVLDEPSIGLSPEDVDRLGSALDGLVERGHTVVTVEHNATLIRRADHVIDLGPGSGREGGTLVGAGAPDEIAALDTPTGRGLRERAAAPAAPPPPRPRSKRRSDTRLEGVCTHNLQGLTVEFPAGALTAIVGVSGSGKSSLAFDTLHAEGRRRFLESIPTYVRERIPGPGAADLAAAHGVTPTIAVRQGGHGFGVHSTVGTLTGVLDDLRTLFSRAGDLAGATARSFAFTHPEGACPDCGGRGERLRCDPSKLVTAPEEPVQAGAMHGSKAGRFYTEAGGQHLAILEAAAAELGIDPTVAVDELDAQTRDVVFHGAGDRIFEVRWAFDRKGRRGVETFEARWLGFCGYVDEEFERKNPDGRAQDLLPLMTAAPCEACEGTRLRATARRSTVCAATLPSLCALPLRDLRTTLQGFDVPILRDTGLGDRIDRRLAMLERCGIGYLSLARTSDSLSSGEARRVQIGGQLIAGLEGTTVVLDEPSAGLHPDDVDELMAVVRSLLAHDTRVVVVDHAPRVLAQADRIIELGPGGGSRGGRIVFEGSPAALESQQTPTAQAVRAWRARTADTRADAAIDSGEDGWIEVSGANLHDLGHCDAAFPRRRLTVVVGRSGAGKSSLVLGALAPSVAAHAPRGCRAIRGHDELAHVRHLDARSLPSQPLLTPLTFLGLADEVAALFAGTPAARALGLAPRAFALGKKGGRCESCLGAGRVRESSTFLGDRWRPCSACSGRRFRPEVLACTVEGLDLGLVFGAELDGVRAALRRDGTQGSSKLLAALERMHDLGLGHLALGQGGDTLSGGEAQRLRLVRELLAPPDEPTLYVLDEPTRALHPQDVPPILAALRGLVDGGHTVVCPTHDPLLEEFADHRIELSRPSQSGGSRRDCAPATEGHGRSGLRSSAE